MEELLIQQINWLAVLILAADIVLVLMICIPFQKQFNKMEEEIDKLKQVIKGYRDRETL